MYVFNGNSMIFLMNTESLISISTYLGNGSTPLNKIGHSSRSSTIQRSITAADQRCLVMFNLENLSLKKTVRLKDRHIEK